MKYYKEIIKMFNLNKIKKSEVNFFQLYYPINKLFETIINYQKFKDLYTATIRLFIFYYLLKQYARETFFIY